MSKLQKIIRLNATVVSQVISLTPSPNHYIEFLRSIVVSIIALLADFGILVALKEGAHANYLVAATISFSIGVVVNYILSVRWAFNNRKLTSKHIEFLVFVVICAVGLAFNLLIIAGGVNYFHLDYRLAKGISTIIVFFWNFLARKKFLY